MAAAADQVKKKPSDFKFGKLIGEGSFSQVFLTQEISTGKEYAMKVLEKRHLIREKKTQYVKREKEILLRIDHPFFVRLHFTFQDEERLYFGLSYARRGELLDYIKKNGCFDEECTRFYVGEITEALEYLRTINVIHRDLKPENILLNDEMHIQISDFGSAKVVEDRPTPLLPQSVKENGMVGAVEGPTSGGSRRNSFVGTAQYVSPEVLKTTESFYSSDLWALGCIIYQLLSGQHPFFGSHEYQIFQKIMKLEYEIPPGFNSTAEDLVKRLLVLDPKRRLGCDEMGGFGPLKQHEFLKSLPWGQLHTTTPPKVLPYLPAIEKNSENMWSDLQAGLDDKKLSRLVEGVLLGADACGGSASASGGGATPAASTAEPKKIKDAWLTAEERRVKLELQERSNEYHRFVERNLILKQGLMDKRKGLFARRRMFLLTEGPRFFYVDPSNMTLKGEIPWSRELRPEAKSFKTLFIHTPNRIYYLEDPEGNALRWCKEITRVWEHYYAATTANPPKTSAPNASTKTSKSVSSSSTANRTSASNTTTTNSKHPVTNNHH